MCLVKWCAVDGYREWCVYAVYVYAACGTKDGPGGPGIEAPHSTSYIRSLLDFYSGQELLFGFHFAQGSCNTCAKMAILIIVLIIEDFLHDHLVQLDHF
jgi:hypothetical protein